MSCLGNYTLKGIQLDCNPVLAGIKNVYLGYFDEFEFTPASDTHTAMISAKGDSKFYKYTITTNTGGLTSTLTRNDQNCTRYYTNTISLQFTRLEAKKHLEVQAMAAEALVAVVETNDGKYWIVGDDNYVSGSNSTAQTGSSFDDLNGYIVELTNRSSHLPYELGADEVAGFLGTLVDTSK